MKNHLTFPIHPCRTQWLPISLQQKLGDQANLLLPTQAIENHIRYKACVLWNVPRTSLKLGPNSSESTGQSNEYILVWLFKLKPSSYGSWLGI